MKKKDLFIAFAFIFCIVVSCSRKENVVQFEIIPIDFDNIKPIDVRDPSIVKLISLETNENSLISLVEKLEIFNNKLYIYDSDKIFIFDMQGKHLHTISLKGHGPGEYTKISSFFIKNGNIHIFDSNTQKLLIYDEDGRFLLSKMLNEGKENTYFTLLCPINENKYIGKNTYRGNVKTPILGFLDANLDAKDQITNRLLTHGIFFSSDWVHVYEDKILYTEMLNDTLFSVQDSLIVPRYYVDFKENKLPPEISAKDLGEALEFVSDPNCDPMIASMMKSISEDSSHLRFIFFWQYDEIIYTKFNKQSKEVLSYRFIDSKNEFKTVGYMLHFDGQTILPAVNSNDSESNPTLIFIDDARLN